MEYQTAVRRRCGARGVVRSRTVQPRPVALLSGRAASRAWCRAARAGEDAINANAPILCCTAECAPPTGDTLVLDEVGLPNRRAGRYDTVSIALRGAGWTNRLHTRPTRSFLDLAVRGIGTSCFGPHVPSKTHVPPNTPWVAHTFFVHTRGSPRDLMTTHRYIRAARPSTIPSPSARGHRRQVHWCTDEGRGAAWTRLLARRGYRHVRVCGRREAEHLLREAGPSSSSHGATQKDWCLMASSPGGCRKIRSSLALESVFQEMNTVWIGDEV